MLKSILQLLLIAGSLIQQARAQSFEQLPNLKDHTARVYYSAGHEQRANFIARHIDKAMAYYTGMLEFKPVVTVLILDTADWRKYTTMGAVYGMPHYNNASKTLFVASQDNPFWKSFLPPLDQLPQPLRDKIQAVYKNSKGELSMQPFFDLLAVHELGHAFHNQAGIIMQRPWMGELFVNLLLHTYIAENEPALLPALTIFPQMVIAAGAREFKYTSLRDIEERYEEIARFHPKNYGWYQCRWHSAAADIYNAGGKQVGGILWNALKSKKEKLTDEEFATFLSSLADKSVLDMMKNWDKRTINP
jgi:hypothetical protein